MSIEKKSLINTLKTTKKANIASAPNSEPASRTTSVKKARAFRKSATRKTKMGVTF
jgi:hypothetical protein